MLSCQRGEFSLPDDLHYLNCAYMAPLPRRVEEAGIEGIRRKRIPSRITAGDFFTESDRARELFARLINAPEPSRIAIIPAASYGISTVARNIPGEPGRNVVLAHQQYPSNVYPWRDLARRTGVRLRTVAPPETTAGRGAEWSRRILEAIDRDTLAVSIGHIHWTDGTRFDLEQIGERARDCGAALVIDGTQSVGALPLDVQRIRPDAVICAGYKWLLGPYSIGLAYFGERFDGGEPLEHGWQARQGSEDFRGLVDYRDDIRPGALRFDVGQRSNFILLPMLITAMEMLLGWGVEPIQAYCRELTRELVAEARSLGFAVEDEEWRASHLFGLRAPAGVDLARVQALLEQRQVVASLRGSALRVSPHLYNEPRDIEALRDVLRQC